MEKQTIKVAGIEFEVTGRYAEGHVLTAIEANVLDQTRFENLRNNFTPKVKKAEEAAKAAGVELDVEKLRAEFATYADEYQFGVKREGTGKTVTDPVEREALRMAKELVKGALRNNGQSIKAVGAEKIAELASGLLEKRPSIREEAKRRVEQAKAMGNDILGGGDDDEAGE